VKVISFVNMKGGVAKTTLAVNVADCLVRRHGMKVLVVDIDPQFNATQTLVSGPDYIAGLEAGQHTIVQVFDDLARPMAGSVEGTETLQPRAISDVLPWQVRPHLFLLPGHLELHRLEMGGGQGREHRLKRYVDHLREQGEFDFVIIDTPPTPSAWMSSALIASDYYVVPVKPEPLSATGIDLLRAVVGRVQDNYALNLQCIGVVLTLAEPNTIVYRQAIDFIDGNPFWNGKRFRTTLPKRTIVARIQGEQQLILDTNDADNSFRRSGTMTENPSKRPVTSRSRDPQRVAAFLEEFSWLISSHSNLDFKAIPEVLRQQFGIGSAANAAVGSYASTNPNKHFLVGALPRVLTDEVLFPTNEDIAQFAQSVMDLSIPRYAKKSKYEIIGHIVCETEHLDDRKLARLVSALAAITDGDDQTKRFIRQRKEQNFNWNAIIQELALGARP
jgi:chromosome partitioning protein